VVLHDYSQDVEYPTGILWMVPGVLEQLGSEHSYFSVAVFVASLRNRMPLAAVVVAGGDSLVGIVVAVAAAAAETAGNSQQVLQTVGEQTQSQHTVRLCAVSMELVAGVRGNNFERRLEKRLDKTVVVAGVAGVGLRDWYATEAAVAGHKKVRRAGLRNSLTSSAWRRPMAGGAIRLWQSAGQRQKDGHNVEDIG